MTILSCGSVRLCDMVMCWWSFLCEEVEIRLESHLYGMSLSPRLRIFHNHSHCVSVICPMIYAAQGSVGFCHIIC